MKKLLLTSSVIFLFCFYSFSQYPGGISAAGFIDKDDPLFYINPAGNSNIQNLIVTGSTTLGILSLGDDLIPKNDGTQNLGETSHYWNNLFLSNALNYKTDFKLFNGGDEKFLFTSDGKIKITGGTPGIGKILTSDANGLATWETPSAPSGNTLDKAYDQGSAGGGRTITADAGAFKVAGTDGVVFTGTVGSGTIPATGGGARMMWYPKKAAFRAGFESVDRWDDENVGIYSTALNYCTTASAFGSTAIGHYTVASGTNSFAMGSQSTASGEGAVAMGRFSSASGKNSFVRNFGSAQMDGSLIITDYSSVDIVVEDSYENRWSSRFANGYRFFTNEGASVGVFLGPNAIAFGIMSDKNKKENFKNVDSEEILQKIGKLELTSWNMKGIDDPTKDRHYGPMAQDFYEAFGHDGMGVIGNDTTICTSDFDGINMIAIQALEKRTNELKEKDKELDEANRRITILEERLVIIEELTNKLLVFESSAK